MMLNNRLRSFINDKHCTLLGIGVMSKNCVDATIEIANNYNIPLMMIASRRQIESAQFGGGYVNNWTTETFAKYVKENDKNNNIILCRDHGGLWQNLFEKEQKLLLDEVMDTAKRSFKVDIESGFDLIHIDTSVDVHNKININESMRRMCELYKYCGEIAKKYGKTVSYEIGSEEQSGTIQNLDDLKYTIENVQECCKINELPLPIFVVVQTGTKLMDRKNVGNFDENYKEIKNVINLCEKYDIMVKEHNTDYLSDPSLIIHPKLGIHAANVAPEFANQETIALIDILKKYNLNDLYEEFLKLSYESNNWRRWVSSNTKTTYIERVILSGHYIFSSYEFNILKNKAKTELQRYGINLDNELKIHIKNSILRYLFNFNMI